MMSREDVERILKQDFTMDKLKELSLQNIEKFDSMTHVPLSSYIRYEDIVAIHTLFSHPKFLNKPKKEKFNICAEILADRDLVMFHSGTNRLLFRHRYDNSFVLKVGVDKVGFSDNRQEYINQHILKPYVPRIYEVTPCGTFQMSEMVTPILTVDQFYNVASDIYDVLNLVFLGKYVMEDIGTDFFMNWGIRPGFGPVLLDFPYVYIADPSKFKCNAINKLSKNRCNGDLRYDDGYNTIICSHCGKRYAAKELGRPITWQDVKEELGLAPKYENMFEDLILWSTNEKGEKIMSKAAVEHMKASTADNILRCSKKFIPKKKPLSKIIRASQTPDDKKIRYMF